MADIAELGVRVTSTGVDQATAGLTKLSGAAAQAEKAVAGNSQNARMMAMQLSQVAQQTQATGNFMQALAIQLPDMALGFGTVGIAIGILAGIMLPLVNGTKLAQAALNGLADVLAIIAPYAIGAAAALALLYAPAIMAGVWGLITAMGSLAASALSVAAAFVVANPAAAFVIGLVAAVSAANIFRDELTKIFGVDIVGAAKTGVNYVIGSFVAAYHDIEFLWKNFPAIIGSAAIGAANMVIQAMGAMIQKAADLVDAFANQANQWLPEGYQIGKIGALGFDKAAFANPYEKQLQDAVGARNSQLQKDLSADYVGVGMKAIETGATAAADKLRDLAKEMGKVDEAKKKASKTDKEAAAYDNIIDSAQGRINAMRAEQAALGMSEEAALKLRYETELLNQAKQRDITLTAAQKAELSGLAGEMAATEIATKNMKEALDFAKGAATGFLSTLRQGLINGEGWFNSLKNAAMSVLDKIASKLEETFVNTLFDSSSSGFNILSLFGLGGTTTSTGGGVISAATSSATNSLAKSSGLLTPANSNKAQTSNQQVEVVVTMRNNGLNIENEVEAVSRRVTAKTVPPMMQDSLKRYRETGLKSDIVSTIKDKRARG